jgi:hypothetical protein
VGGVKVDFEDDPVIVNVSMSPTTVQITNTAADRRVMLRTIIYPS